MGDSLDRSGTDIVPGLIGKKFPVLDKGWIALAGVMGTDQTIVDRARGTIGESARKVSSDRDLIRLMMRHHHGSSFEFPEIDVQICTTFVVWRQMIRHRAGNILDDMTMWDEPSVNELSGRYSEVPDMIQETRPDEWRKQSKANRQGSEGAVNEWPAGQPFTGLYKSPGHALTKSEDSLNVHTKIVYDEMIRFGVAKEQARKVWPMGGYTIGFMKMDLRNWLHWLTLRLAPDAQKEIRDYARVIADQIVAPLFPETWSAFSDYVLNAITLTAKDIDVIFSILNPRPIGELEEYVLNNSFRNNRERAECRSKLIRLGILDEPTDPAEPTINKEG